MAQGRKMRMRGWMAALLAAAALGAAPLVAQVQAVDPDRAIDGDLAPAPAAPVDAPPAPTAPAAPVPTPAPTPLAGPTPMAPGGPVAAQPGVAVTTTGGTYQRDDLVGAAEGVFGKGARGLAQIIEDTLRRQGEPNGYIVGREGGGALIFGVRYGSGTLYHKTEGQMPVYWTGPSLGIDAGVAAGNTFVLVYNLHDTADLYHNYGAGEGQAYILGGFNASYLRRGDVVLIPIRMGMGLRLGVNAGYMRFSRRQRWIPF